MFNQCRLSKPGFQTKEYTSKPILSGSLQHSHNAPHVARRVCLLANVSFWLFAAIRKLKGLESFFAYSAQPSRSTQPREPAMVFQVGDQVKRGEEIGEVGAVVGSMMIVKVGNTQVAGPTIEWEAVTEVIFSPLGVPQEDKNIYCFFLLG